MNELIKFMSLSLKGWTSQDIFLQPLDHNPWENIGAILKHSKILEVI